MCGIFGMIGTGDVVGMLADGIRRLEYRGYDSWGMAVFADSDLAVHRQPGRMTGVEQAFRERTAGAPGGIAHTRWATHGEPSARNAHPHVSSSGRIAAVHNGIIENHESLRHMLEAEGCEFRSDTDTEVIAHLVEKFYDGSNLRAAFTDALKLLRGAYAIALVCADAPDVIYIGRDSSPICIGCADGIGVVASDASAIVAHTREVAYLGDKEIAELRSNGWRVWNLDDEPLERKARKVAFDLEAVEKGRYEHFMIKEICEQPETIANAMRGRLLRGEGTARLDGLGFTPAELRSIRAIRILACGTSWHAGLVGKYMIEQLARIPVTVDYAAEFRYAARVLEPGTLVIAVSQSGETADTLAAVREAKRLGASVAGICNVVGSTIARECGRGIYLHAGPEIGVASSKAFTSQMTVLALLALYLGRSRGMSLGDGLRFLDALESLPEAAHKVLEQKDAAAEVARRLAEKNHVLYIGRLYEYPLALEGALKIKEISYIHAEGLPAAELKHGPIALIDPDMPTVVLAAQEGILDKMKSNVREIHSRGGRIFVVRRAGSDAFTDLAEMAIDLPEMPDPLVPILGAIPMQLLAYYAAVERGCDVDRPRNLAKSVTVE